VHESRSLLPFFSSLRKLIGENWVKVESRRRLLCEDGKLYQAKVVLANLAACALQKDSSFDAMNQIHPLS